MEVETIGTSCNVMLDLSSLIDSCRVCMAQSIHLRSIFDIETQNIIEEIHFCTGIRITPENGLPSQICDVCINNLSVAYKFKSSCILADETFHKLLLSSTIKAEVHDNEYEELTEYKDETEDFEKVFKEEVVETLLIQKRVNKSPRIRVKKKKDGLTPVKALPIKPATRPKAPRRLKKFKHRKLWCEPCNIKFDTKEQSDEHKREMHKDCENWVCEICGKMFIHRASHYTHVKSHQPPKYACDQCDYKTWHKYDLVKHIRIHTGLKMYQCEYCTSSYYTSSNLTSHIRRHHMNERPHACNICQRTFFDRTKLNRHLDSHLDIKRFECNICHACFTRRCYWKKHLLRQHDIVTPPQRPGRQKINLVIGEYLVNSKQEAIGEFYAKEGAKKV